MGRRPRYDTHPALTPREQEVRALLGEGLSDAQIADRLGISAAGVSYHVSEIIGKLGVRNRYEAAAWPERAPRWAGGLAPVTHLWRKATASFPAKTHSVAAVASGGTLAAALGGLGLIAVLVWRSGGDAVEPPSFSANPSPPAGLSRPAVVFPSPPTATAESTPLPITEPAAPLVYLLNGDLWVGGGARPPRPIASNSRYAGHVVQPAGNHNLYYVEELSRREPAPGRVIGEAELAVRYVSMDGNRSGEVIRFEGRAYEHEIQPSDAAISPDGRYVAYADLEGLALLEIESGETTRLLEGVTECPDFLSCFSFGRPSWSPNGEWLLVARLEWEESWLVLIDPFATPPAFTELGEADGTGWPLDRQLVCIWMRGPLHSPRAAIYDVGTRSTTEPVPGLESSAPGGGSIETRGCAWAADGRLAFGASTSVDGPGQITILSSDVDAARITPIVDLQQVVAWLPDSSGVIFNRFTPQGETPGPAVYRPGEGLFALPFEADWAVAVIP